jgi:hypothetical protein
MVLLSERYIYDILKRDFDLWERASVIQDYMKSEGLSQAGFCRKFGIPETTLHTWIKISKNEELYKSVLDKGGSKTEAFKIARGDKIVPSGSVEKALYSMKCDVARFRKEDFVHSPNIIYIIQELVNELNVLHMEIERKKK